jgi:uncharacterized protein (DUF3820 family)
MTLSFGKFKGQEFESTPTWYQSWLLKQDWFEHPKKQVSESYALIENGVIHTDDIDLESANEMLERHKRTFPNCHWEILPMSAVNGFEKAEGILERHSRIARRYFY